MIQMHHYSTAACDVTTESAPCARELIKLLGDIAKVIHALGDVQYTKNPVGPFRCTIGAQVRHCLDHFESLCAGLFTGRLDYDSRDRGTKVETSRLAALAAIAELENRLAGFTQDDCDRTLIMTHMTSSELEPLILLTSVSRELAYVQCHTIHHQAMISAMATLLGVEVPTGFGFAPSTIAHLKRTEAPERPACVR